MEGYEVTKQTAQHLNRWVTSTVADADRDIVIDKILNFVHDYPEVVERNTWTEIRRMAEAY